MKFYRIQHCQIIRIEIKNDAWTTLATYFQTDKDEIEKKMKSLIGQFQIVTLYF